MRMHTAPTKLTTALASTPFPVVPGPMGIQKRAPAFATALDDVMVWSIKFDPHILPKCSVLRVPV